jgi:inner membrane protein
MTAAVAAKFVGQKHSENFKPSSRAIFWLLVVSVNFPDLDVLMAAFRDPILTIKTHRWITHSVLIAPFFALVPASIFYRFSSVKNFRFLWLTAMLGMYIHIASDLVTPYGTQLLAPFSTHRFTLSSLFIVDLYFSVGLLTFILLGKYNSRRKSFWHKTGLVFMISYLVTTFGIQMYADNRVRRVVEAQKIEYTKISTLPLPFSIFDWVGIVQTNTGVHRAFFSVFDDALSFEELRHSSDAFTEKARQHVDSKWYFEFAHHPLVQSFDQENLHVVEIHDLQFSAPARIVKMLGLKKPRTPFTLKFTFNRSGEILTTSFND